MNSQLSTIESKKQTEQTSRTETESYIWRSFGGLSVGRKKRENGGKGAGIKKYKLVGTEQLGDVKNSTGNGVDKELIRTTHGHELRGVLPERMGAAGGRGIGEKIGTTITASSIKYF